jgi:hypothetical protein
MSDCQTRSPSRGRTTRRKRKRRAAQCRISTAPSAADVDDRSDACKALKHRRRVVVGLPRIRMTTIMMRMIMSVTETQTTMAAAAMPHAAAHSAATPL